MRTTREAARDESHGKLVHHLQDLLEKNYDAEKGYKKAMEDAANKHLKKFLQKQAVRRNHFATEIDKQLHILNEHPKEKSSTLSGFHRVWIDLKTNFSKKDDESVLEECIRGEKASLRDYEEKLKHNTYPADVEALLKHQKNEIKATLSRVTTLEDLADH